MSVIGRTTKDQQSRVGCGAGKPFKIIFTSKFLQIMKKDIKSTIDELLKKSKTIPKKSDFRFKGKIISRGNHTIDFATEQGILEVPIAEIDDIVQLLPDKNDSQDFVEIKMKSLTKTSFKYRVPFGRPGGGFGTLNVFTLVDTTDTTTVTYQSSPDATDDVDPVGTDDPDGPIYV